MFVQKNAQSSGTHIQRQPFQKIPKIAMNATMTGNAYFSFFPNSTYITCPPSN